jgi:hypothetical protein
MVARARGLESGLRVLDFWTEYILALYGLSLALGYQLVAVCWSGCRLVAWVVRTNSSTYLYPNFAAVREG